MRYWPTQARIEHEIEALIPCPAQIYNTIHYLTLEKFFVKLRSDKFNGRRVMYQPEVESNHALNIFAT